MMVALDLATDQRLEAKAKAVKFAACSDTDACRDTAGPLHLRYAISADRGRRRDMEDAAIATQLDFADGTRHETGLFAVFDGHNGSHAAQFAAAHLSQQLTSNELFPADIKASLAQSFLQLDQQYFAAVSDSVGESAGTTALAAVVWGGTLFVANAGDSRAVLSRSGRAIELTRDHKPGEPSERARIERSGGYVCPEGLCCGELAVARAIGDFHLPELKPSGDAASGAAGPLTAEPELTQHELLPGDEFMLLACDGLWDVFSSQRAVEFARGRLREHNDVQRCADELVAEAMRMHSSDNVTVIAVCFSEEAPPKRVYGRVGRSVSRDGLSALAGLLSES